MTYATAAQRAVVFYQKELEVDREIIKHVPLHYGMADLVLGLMELAKARGLDWKLIVRDAKESLPKE